jgi:serine/threonine protein kinase
MINRTIRNFEIKELIATGGMAAIYKAIQVSLDRVVAIKILHGHLAQDKNFITRFEREAKAAANLKHENIVNIIDFGQAEDVYFIAMEYVEGKSLKDLIVTIKFVPHDIAMVIAHNISQGLNHAHQKGVVHRDVKPANVLIGYDGTVKIADFGLAQAQDLTSITVTGSIVGTPAYMSPEQAAGKKVDHRSDIFSLGVVIYEMLTGVKPFGGENYSAVIHEILTVKPPKPTDANPLVTREISGVIEKMLEKDLDKRYQNISETCEDIYSYFRRKNIEISRKKIGEFISAPDKQFRNLVNRRKAKHFERGLYYMNLGYEKIDDAINEFTKVLHLDSDDIQAKKYLTELKKKKEKIVVKERKVVKKKEKVEVPTKKSKFAPIAVISGVLIVAIILVAAIIKRPGRPVSPGKTGVFGVAKITSVPEGASISLDNTDLKLETPAILDSLSVGKHNVRLTKTGFKPHSENFEIRKGDTLNLRPVLSKDTKPVKYGSISIKSKPTGASVFLDGINKRVKTPCTINNVQEGVHHIKLTKKGYNPAEFDRKVTQGRTVQISVTLSKTKEKPITAKQYSYLKLTVKPWAKIYIDNKYVETTPIARPLRVASGTRTVKLENPNFKVWQKRIKFTPGETKNLDVRLQRFDGHLKLTVKPWADVYIDGKFYETTPIAKPIKLTAGKHILKLVNPSFRTVEQEIRITANKMLKKYVELKPK